MSIRVILTTGGDGCLGEAVARAFLAEIANNSVRLGVHSRRERAEKLAGQYPGRWHKINFVGN